MGVPLEKWETVWRTKVDAEVDQLLGVLCSRYGTSWVLVWLVNALLLDNGGILRASRVFFSFLVDTWKYLFDVSIVEDCESEN